MGFLCLIVFIFSLSLSLQSNSDILRKGNGGPFILPGGSTQPKVAPVYYTKPRQPASTEAKTESIAPQKISEEQKLQPATVYMGGNGKVSNSGGGSGMAFLNLSIAHSYSDTMPDEGTYYIGSSAGYANSARQRLDYYVEVESVDGPELQFRRVVFYRTKGYDVFIEFIAAFDSEDLYNSKLYYCSKAVRTMSEPCDKNEITVKSKNLFGNISEMIRDQLRYNSPTKKDELLWKLYNNGKSLLGLR